MWFEDISVEEHAYGTTPNEFLEENVSCIPKGKVLSLAEGEGRNAVFLAKQGYAVTAVEFGAGTWPREQDVAPRCSLPKWFPSKVQTPSVVFAD